MWRGTDERMPGVCSGSARGAFSAFGVNCGEEDEPIST
jgi:hypothetical protein